MQSEGTDGIHERTQCLVPALVGDVAGLGVELSGEAVVLLRVLFGLFLHNIW